MGACLSASPTCRSLSKPSISPILPHSLYALYRQTHWSVPDWAVSAAGLGYAGVILLACITGTSFSSYNAGYGYSGWFYAANDVSIVIMLTAPLIICQFFSQIGHTPRPQSLGLGGVGHRVRCTSIQRRFPGHQAGVLGRPVVSGRRLPMVWVPLDSDASGRRWTVLGGSFWH